MTRAWVTASSTNLVSMVNPLTAACEEGFVPTQLHFLDNPGVTEQVDQAIDVATTIVTEYGADEPEIHLTTLDADHEFETIHAHFRDAIEAVQAASGEVAVDITPGRKFMSAIAFTAGMRYGADHVYYMYLRNPRAYGSSYPEKPRTAATLYDFTEVL